MSKLANAQKRVDKALSAFTNIVKELDGAIKELTEERTRNDAVILAMQAYNEEATEKISEYKATKAKIENILN